jgi:membrane protein
MGVYRAVERVVRETWQEMREENIAFMAGSIAYYAFISMLPLLLFALFVLSAVDNASLTAYLYSTTERVLTPHARQLLIESLDSTSARTGISVVSALTILWGTSRILRALDVAFSEIYGVEETKSVLAQARDAAIVAVALVAAIVVVVAAGVVFALVPDLPYPAVVNPLLLVLGLSLTFFPIYYVFPDVDVRPIEVLPGTVLAAVGWATLEAAFQGYVALAGRYEAVYGTLGSAFLLLVWLYFSGLVLLVGGVVNAVLAGRTLDEHALGTPENFEIDESAGEPDESAGESGDLTGNPDELANESGELTNESNGSDRDEPTHPLTDAPRDVRRDVARQRVEADRAETGRGEDGRAASSQVETHRRSLRERRAAADGDAERRLSREEVERLATELERAEAENEQLRAEREELRRDRADLARRLERRRRSLWERAKGWLSRRKK